MLLVRGRVSLGIAICALALILPIAGHALLVEFVVRAYQVPSESMQPTLEAEDWVLVDRTGIGGLDVGDMVAFHPPTGAEAGAACGVRHPSDQACPIPTATASDQTFLKRIVAGPGDRLSIRHGHAVVNGVTERDDAHATGCAGSICNMPQPIEIPEGHYFVLGDNRGASDDSRFWGPVPEDWIVGVVFARYAPIGQASIF